MRASRLISLLLLLQLRGRQSATALARELEVSVRTIHRDLEALAAAGIPVYAERGRSGGIVLTEGFRTRLTGLTRVEAESLAFAGLAGAAADLGLGAEATAARLKLFASLPSDASAGAKRMAERFHLDPLPWYHHGEPVGALPELATAVWQQRKVQIDYQSWTATKRHELAPLGLVLKAGIWYLVAAQADEPRTFRVANIRSHSLLETTFERPRDFDLAAYWPRWLADFEHRLFAATARVRLTEEGLRVLRAASPLAAARATASRGRTSADGWLEAEIPIEAVASSARQLLQLGSEFEVLSPPELRAEVEAQARNIVALHHQPRRERSP